MEKLLEKLEAAVLVLECIWRMRECENSHAVERAYEILEEFLKEGDNSLEAARKLAERMDEVLEECECVKC
jgi:Zn-finger protein